MSLRTVHAPVANYSGVAAGVEFVDGAGTVHSDNTPAVAYFRRHGYRFERVDVTPAAPSTPEPTPEPDLPPAASAPALTLPAKSANKPEWIAYAISQGADPQDAEAASKADLVETYGGAA